MALQILLATIRGFLCQLYWLSLPSPHLLVGLSCAKRVRRHKNYKWHWHIALAPFSIHNNEQESRYPTDLSEPYLQSAGQPDYIALVYTGFYLGLSMGSKTQFSGRGNTRHQFHIVTLSGGFRVKLTSNYPSIDRSHPNESASNHNKFLVATIGVAIWLTCIVANLQVR